MAEREEFPAFAEWTPPWKDSESFDADKAAKLLYNLSKDKHALQAKVADKDTEIGTLKSAVDEHEAKNLTETQRLQRENEKLTQEATEKVRLEVALEKGLTLSQARRLVGKTREELAKDADDYLAEHGGAKAPTEDKATEKTAEKPPSNRVKGNLKSGTESADSQDEKYDPASLQQVLPPSRF